MQHHHGKRTRQHPRWTLMTVLTIMGIVASLFGYPDHAQATAQDLYTRSPGAPSHPYVAPLKATFPAPEKHDTPQVVERTAFTRTERNNDGTLSTMIASRPLHWQDEASKEWKEFDNVLKHAAAADADTSFENGANTFKVKFGKPDQVAKGKPVVRLSLGTVSIDVTAVGAAPATVQADGAQLTYTDAYPSADLRYTLDNERVKEDIILKQAPTTAPVYTFDVALKGVTATQQPDGTISFVDGGGATVFTMLTPFMLDSSPQPEQRFSDAVQMTLKQSGKDQVQIQVLPDLQWLRDPARVYPVFVDPTLEDQRGYPTNSAIVDQASPTTNYANRGFLYVGKTSSGQRTDSLLQYAGVNKLPREVVVTNAQLWLKASSGTSGMPIEVQRITSAWNPTTVTWNTAPSAVGVSSFNYTPTAYALDNHVDVSSIVRSWVRGEAPNHGIRLASQGANGAAVRFDVSEYSTILSIRYVPETRNGLNGLWTYTTQQYGGGNTSYVNTSTGNVVLQHAGGTIPARGFGVDLTHIYNSQDSYGLAQTDRVGAFYGEGWTFSQNLRLSELDRGDGVVFKDGSGGDNRVYAKDQDVGTTRTYVRPLYYDLTLTKDLANPPADAAKVYTLAADSGGVKLYFDAQGKITRQQDRNSNYLNYEYDTNGRLITITDVAGRQTRLEYNEVGGRLSKIIDMAGRVSTYGYDTSGNLTTITHGVGTINATTRFAYDIGNMVSSITDPNNNTSNIGYRGEYFWATAGDTEGWTGIGNSTVSQSTEQKFRGTGSLRVNVNTGDPSTSVGAKRTFDPPVAWNSLQQEVLGFVYLPTGSQVDAQLGLTTVDGSSYAGSFIRVVGGQWTALRMPYAQISPAFKIKELRLAISTTSNGSPVYNGPIWLDQVMVKGIARSLTDAKPAKNTLSVYRYDWLNRLTYVAQPDQNGIERNTVYEYANFGEVTKVTDPLGNSTSASYDAELRLTTMQEPNGATTRLSYYPNSNEVQTTTNPTGEMRRQGVNTATGDLRYTLDERNEQRRTDNQDFVAMIYVRDGVGNVTSMQTNRYAAGTNLEQSPLPAPLGTLREIKYTYGAGGVVTSMTDPNGNTTNFTYDTNTGYRTGSDAPAGNGETSRRFTTSTYNPDGSVQRITDPKGQIITLEYDGLGRLIKANYGVDTASAFSTTFTLDRNGNTTAMSDNSGTSSWAYDANNALTNEVRTQNGATRTANSTYFANGLLQSRSTLSGQTVNYSYDVGNRPLTQTDPNDGGRAITYGYDSDGRLATKTFPSGVSQRLVYDLAGLVDLITLQRGDGTVLQRFDYDYGIDANGTRAPEYWNGNVLSVTELDGSKVTYRYDDLDRLASAVRTGSAPFNQQFGYDRNSNRTSVISEGTTTNAAYDAANQVMSYGATTYAYDRNGNQVRSGSDQMTYDVANRWTSGTVNGQTVASSYDGRGQRVSKTVAGARTDFWYDQTGLTQETGANTATYLRDMGGTLLSTNTGGTTYNYGQDRLGSITALAGTDGTLVNSYTYTPYGFLQASTGSVPNPFRFAGTYQDSGAYYQMGARYYHQPTGRFTQQDPLPCTNNGGQPYTYANADPANSADPDGLCYWRQSYRQVWGFVPYVYWGCRGVCSSPAAFARRFPYIMRTEWQVRAIVCHDYCLPRSWGSYSVPVFQLVCGSFVVREIVGLACHPTDWRCMLGR